MEARVVAGNLVVLPGKVKSGETVEGWLEGALGLPSAFAGKLCAKHCVRSSKGPLKAEDAMPLNGRLWLINEAETDEAKAGGFLQSAITNPSSAAAGHPTVLFEDDHLFVVDKPAGWLIHSDGATTTPVLQDAVNGWLSERGEGVHAYHVHRLDRDTTGCVLFAKHEFMARALDGMLALHKIHRTYLGIVHGRMPQRAGRIDKPIGRDRHVAGKFRVSESGKKAVTHFCELAFSEDPCASLIECRLETGRTHQIRVHLADSGCPLFGDPLYSPDTEAVLNPAVGHSGQALHAWKLDFTHPYTKESIAVKAPMPHSFQSILRNLGIEWR